ncbi:MAG: amidohydrolase family protein [Chloroflexota bacterium]
MTSDDGWRTTGASQPVDVAPEQRIVGDGVAGGWSPLIDGDVHITWRAADELLAYLPRVWHARLRSGRGAPRIRPAFYLPHRGYHKEAAAPEGGPPGSDPATLARDWLDRHGIAYAVLNHFDLPVISTWGDIDYPNDLARAYNDWLIERWLVHDRRFLGSMVVATQDAVAAAAEIDRVGQHPQLVQVLLASGTRLPYGVRAFQPIYAAAARHGLHVAIHTGTEGLGTSNPPTSAGWPSYAMEWRACQPQNLAAHVVSLVTEGVFVQFPDLKLVLLEGGAAWLPQLLWRLDKNYKAMRSECPWLRELPSAYLLRHVRFGTQGLERPDDPDHLWTMLRMMEGERVLLYASNYPRWDVEAPGECVVLRSAEPEARRRIAHENARQLYGLPRVARSSPARAVL